MANREHKTWEVVCPSCGARPKVDAVLGKVISHQSPSRHVKAPDLEHVGKLLEKERARREALFKQSAEEQKTKSDLLDRKFQEALKKSKDEPAAPPPRDIDLD